MNTKARELFDKLMIACDSLNAHPIVLFARGSVANREALIMLAGPVLTLESLAKLRVDIQECLDAKEKQLQGKSDPGTVVVGI
jgi:hypothetical protein